MKTSLDRLARDLEAIIGRSNVREPSAVVAGSMADGGSPKLLCFPEDPALVGPILRTCSEAGARIVPWGGGTALRVGNAPAEVDVAIALARLDRCIDYDHANLTVTTGAGVSVARLNQTLAERKQFLAFDPPYADRATVGGTVAANINGPRRAFYGSVRDLVIGVRVALARGETIKAGGKVVKNVAGYDLCKLFVGSFGTLGVITEVTLKLAPLPERTASVLISGPLSALIALNRQLASSPLLPTAITLWRSGTAKAEPDAWELAVRSEGFTETVARHVRDLVSMADRARLKHRILEGESELRCWQEMRDFPLDPSLSVYRLTLPLANTAAGVEALARHPVTSRLLADLCSGTVWITFGQPGPWFTELRELAARERGHVVWFAATAAEKQGTDVWGAPPPGYPLMREIKRQFDPAGLLNPGRFLGCM